MQLQKAMLVCLQEELPFVLCILPTKFQPTGILWQNGPLLWVYSKSFPAKTLEYYPTAVADIALLGIQQALQFFGQTPYQLIVPYTSYQFNVL